MGSCRLHMLDSVVVCKTKKEKLYWCLLSFPQCFQNLCPSVSLSCFTYAFHICCITELRCVKFSRPGVVHFCSSKRKFVTQREMTVGLDVSAKLKQPNHRKLNYATKMSVVIRFHSALAALFARAARDAFSSAQLYVFHHRRPVAVMPRVRGKTSQFEQLQTDQLLRP